MKEEVKVAVAQLSFEQATYDVELKNNNVAKIINYIEKYGKESDLIVFPELATVGYIHLGGYAPLHDYKYNYWNAAEDITNSETLRAIENAATKAGCICIVGFAERSKVKGEIYNSAALIEPGKDIAFQRKIHLPTEENHYFIPGSEIAVFNTGIGKLSIALCYDFVFPETIRISALKGAEMAIITANVLDSHNFREMSRAIPIARAIENQIHVVFCNEVGALKTKRQLVTAFGQSKIINSLGDILAEAPADEECAISAVLTQKDLEKSTMFLAPFRDRRPELYDTITRPLHQ
jgi:N-carbamoylputrescine amidase